MLLNCCSPAIHIAGAWETSRSMLFTQGLDIISRLVDKHGDDDYGDGDGDDDEEEEGDEGDDEEK